MLLSFSPTLASAVASPAATPQTPDQPADPFDALVDRALGQEQENPTDAQDLSVLPTPPEKGKGTGRGAGVAKSSGPAKTLSQPPTETPEVPGLPPCELPGVMALVLPASELSPVPNHSSNLEANPKPAAPEANSAQPLVPVLPAIPAWVPDLTPASAGIAAPAPVPPPAPAGNPVPRTPAPSPQTLPLNQNSGRAGRDLVMLNTALPDSPVSATETSNAGPAISAPAPAQNPFAETLLPVETSSRGEQHAPVLEPTLQAPLAAAAETPILEANPLPLATATTPDSGEAAPAPDAVSSASTPTAEHAPESDNAKLAAPPRGRVRTVTRASAAAYSVAPAMLDAQAVPRLGTASAKQDTPMKKAEEMLKTAEPAQQKMPSDAFSGSPAASAQSGEAASAPATVPAERVHFASANAAAVSTVSATSTAAPVAERPHLPQDARLSALERTHDLVATHAVRVRESNTDTMRVVIEPGAGMHLALELRWHKDGIDVQASVNRGDYDFLSHHWSELQQRLEPRGIHLGALECPHAAVSDQSSNQHSQRQFPGEEPARRAWGAPAFSGATTVTTATRPARRQTQQGWETWA